MSLTYFPAGLLRDIRQPTTVSRGLMNAKIWPLSSQQCPRPGQQQKMQNGQRGHDGPRNHQLCHWQGDGTQQGGLYLQWRGHTIPGGDVQRGNNDEATQTSARLTKRHRLSESNEGKADNAMGTKQGKQEMSLTWKFHWGKADKAMKPGWVATKQKYNNQLKFTHLLRDWLTPGLDITCYGDDIILYFQKNLKRKYYHIIFYLI